MYALIIPFIFGFFAHAYATTTILPFTRPERLLSRYQSFLFVLSILVILLFLTKPHNDEQHLKINILSRIGAQKIRTLLLLASSTPIIIYASRHFNATPGYITTLKNVKTTQYAFENHLPIFIAKNKNNRLTIKKILKFQALFSNKNFYGKVNNIHDHTFNLKEFKSVYYKGSEYILIEKNGFKEDLKENYIFLDIF